MSGVVQFPPPKIRCFAIELRPFLASSKQFFRLSHFGATAPSPRIQISAGQLGGRQCPKWGTDRRILGRLAWPAGLARWLSKLGCRAGLPGWAARLSCPSPRVAVWLAGWPGRLAGLPGLACPPAPPPLQTPQPAQPANSELARRLGRRAAPATPQKAASKADNQSSLRPNSDKPVAPVVG